MPRFVFHYRDNSRDFRDPEAVALPDAEAAWFHAVRSARDLIDAELRIGHPLPDCRVEIADECGRPVDALPLSEVAALAG